MISNRSVSRAPNLEKPNRDSTGGSILSPLTTVDIIVCIVFPFAGIVVGLVRAVQRRPGAKKMLGLSALVMVIAFVLRFGVA